MRLKSAAFLGTGLLALMLAAGGGLHALDRAYPPPLGETRDTSVEVTGRNGALLRAFATDDGVWRFRIELDAVDPKLIDMLIAYEDKRFWSHGGVDPLAIGRAALQLVTNGRIVSGGSTITMQVARLLEPRSARSVGAKLRQMVRAIQIERRLSKQRILELYLTLTPYGGNLEGVRAATLAWFGKEPRRLDVAEAALLVALPQLPERRRPDRNRDGAAAARERVLHRVADTGLVDMAEIERALAQPVPSRRLALPALAAHSAYDAIRAHPGREHYELTIDRLVQEGLERIASDAARRLGSRLSVAMVLADARTGAVLGHVGSADYFDVSRAGWIDMTKAVRSPGSTLKPFIYGLAMEQGLVAQETIVEDRPSSFGGYRPRNFDMAYQGDVSVRQALQMSLNVPAVQLLDSIGPARLAARLRQAGVRLELPRGEAPGLAVALGGAGTTLEQLVQLYTGLANRGNASPLHEKPPAQGLAERVTMRLLEPQSAWQVADMLSGVAPPQGASRRGIAYKTGTSYGYRDAWSVGFDGRHVLGVWVGRPDGGAVPGLSGYQSAAPILFEAFARSGLPVTPLPPAPPGALRMAAAQLPVTLRRFSRNGPAVQGLAEPAPEIVYPPAGARVSLGAREGNASALVLKLQGGRAPFRWLANGRPLDTTSRRRTMNWVPDGAGNSKLTVIDAAGRTASVSVFVE